MTKAQDFIKKYAPQYEGSDTIPHHAVLALMESFKSQCMIEYLDTLIKPKPNEAAILDAVIDEDKMTIKEVYFLHEVQNLYWCLFGEELEVKL